MRQVVLDTETTGIGEGHRIIEIGCVELINRKLTGRHYHVYINPQRAVDAEAIEVHGIDDAFLADKPLFADVAEDFYRFIEGAELVIHNAAFDVGFMNVEFGLLGGYPRVDQFCGVLDTLKLARAMHPGQRNSLDALCKRYGIDNSHRELHGALLDAEILADVYLMMTGGQTALFHEEKDSDENKQQAETSQMVHVPISADLSGQLRVVYASPEELQAHETFLDLLDKKSGAALWRKPD
ncbi:MAG: DNA polymerase III subunit epsilon [Oceanospirillaceae bacterium]|nr:DNA polymerase III subunit epsilon [Oceanospirillaceae bacterium]